MFKYYCKVLIIVVFLPFQMASAEVCDPQESYFSSRDTLEAWVGECPASGLAIYQLAMNLVSQGEVDQALSVLTPVLDDDQVESRFPGVLLYAQLILNKGEVDRSLAIANSLNEQVPNVREVLYLLARTNLLKGNYRESKGYASQVVSQWNISNAYSILIVSDYQLDDYAGALTAYEKALDVNVSKEALFEDPAVALAVSHSYFLQGNGKAAAAVMREELSRSPDLAKDQWVTKYIVDMKRSGLWD